MGNFLCIEEILTASTNTKKPPDVPMEPPQVQVIPKQGIITWGDAWDFVTEEELSTLNMKQHAN